MARLSTDRACWMLDATTWDLVVPIVWLSGAAAAAQRIAIRLRAFRGEWFADTSFGTPWIEGLGVAPRDAILGQRFDAAKARAAIREAILATANVAAIIQLDVAFDAQTRTVTARFRVRCSFEDISVDAALQTVEI